MTRIGLPATVRLACSELCLALSASQGASPHLSKGSKGPLPSALVHVCLIHLETSSHHLRTPRPVCQRLPLLPPVPTPIFNFARTVRVPPRAKSSFLAFSSTSDARCAGLHARHLQPVRHTCTHRNLLSPSLSGQPKFTKSFCTPTSVESVVTHSCDTFKIVAWVFDAGHTNVTRPDSATRRTK